MTTFRFEIHCKDDAWRWIFCRSLNGSDEVTGSQIISTEIRERAYVAYSEESAHNSLAYFSEHANGCQVRIANESKPQRVKSVEWAYPSSDTAKRFGKGRTGCWVLQVGNAGEPLEAITAHAERESALQHAHNLAIEWDSSFCAIHPEDAHRLQPFVFSRV